MNAQEYTEPTAQNKESNQKSCVGESENICETRGLTIRECLHIEAEHLLDKAKFLRELADSLPPKLPHGATQVLKQMINKFLSK